MFHNNHTYSSFSVDDIAKAQDFYGKTLGVKVESDGYGLKLHLNGTEVYVLPFGPEHKPPVFHVLNFDVDDIEQAVADLKQKGVIIEIIDGMEHDHLGIMRGKAAGTGPDMAIFPNPAGNMLAVIEE